ADSAAQGGNHGANFFVTKHLVVARLLHVQDFSFERQDRLEAPITSLLCRATGGLTLDQVDLAAIRLALRAVCEFAGKAASVERSFAACKVARLTRSFARTRRFNGLIDDATGDRRVLLEESTQTLVDEGLHYTGDIGVELAFGLSFKLRL